ncbi:DUF2852 domain-containing protein [Ancylobacter defluvii]|uniref:DUF2852 domain-containing protein n=1 Tax=Ancylobacter defluvii TaxID=1282440 RepID=A0A9W6JU77_9HYPH|nr:DUF2852 domain-containing protein [Ancylobacter defluvii]MBS7587484.1 DUF2852 domain-containing protein [Ancylobacter defluvii]GLK82175.1 hypothetical protein GCM10017653_02440 [Ancylobacter defluvii]
MELAYKLDSYGKPAWIALTVLGFMAWWPLGLAILAFTIGSGRMGCGGRRGFARWQEEGGEAFRNAFGRWGRGMPSSGNRAFDEYREETLRRLEDEQKDFRGFLDRLRQAKDKAEFDQFMADRRRPAPQNPEPPVDGATGN